MLDRQDGQDSRKLERTGTLTQIINRPSVLHLVLRMRQEAAKNGHSNSNETSAVPAAANSNEISAVHAAPEGLCHHNIGATLKLMAMLLKSYINSNHAPTIDRHGHKIYPSFRILLPGTKTYLVYNTETNTVCIYDDTCNIHYTPGMPVNSPFPNSTDPRVAVHIFALLVATCDNQDIYDVIKNLEFFLEVVSYPENVEKKLVQELLTCGLFNKNSPVETLRPKQHLYAIRLTGRESILLLIELLEKAFLKHKGRIIPLEEDAQNTLRHTL